MGPQSVSIGHLEICATWTSRYVGDSFHRSPTEASGEGTTGVSQRDTRPKAVRPTFRGIHSHDWMRCCGCVLDASQESAWTWQLPKTFCTCHDEWVF